MKEVKKRILVVDDNPQLVDLLRIRLEYSGFEVLTAFDGKEGLDKARNDNPDLIILDVMLPKMNGYKVCRLLKFDQKYKHIPIVMLSSRAKESDAAIGIQTGANEYVFKPYDQKKLIEIVNKYVNVLFLEECKKN
ncbi:response regulator [candidate division KSB1 bacterium]|nr:response regulator [candidate division KSB1 bacterium]